MVAGYFLGERWHGFCVCMCPWKFEKVVWWTQGIYLFIQLAPWLDYADVTAWLQHISTVLRKLAAGLIPVLQGKHRSDSLTSSMTSSETGSMLYHYGMDSKELSGSYMWVKTLIFCLLRLPLQGYCAAWRFGLDNNLEREWLVITLILMLLCVHRTVFYLCTVLCSALSLFLYACTYACVFLVCLFYTHPARVCCCA